MQTKQILLILTLMLNFIGCGEEPETPTPATSQNEKVLDESVEENESQASREFQNIKDSNNTIPIGETNISLIDGSTEEVIAEQDEQPLLIGEDIDYINTQFESVYFDFDRYSIKESMLVPLTKNIKLINSPRVTGKNIIIEGNCDEWGTDEYNYALGLKRAQVVKEALIADGINEERIQVLSYGESNPVCLEQEDDCWAKNRRVDFKLVQ